jgi:hypothetical protein
MAVSEQSAGTDAARSRQIFPSLIRDVSRVTLGVRAGKKQSKRLILQVIPVDLVPLRTYV